VSNGDNPSPASRTIPEAVLNGFFFAAGMALFGFATSFFVRSSDDDDDDDEADE
jgi:hypothetical protein